MSDDFDRMRDESADEYAHKNAPEGLIDPVKLYAFTAGADWAGQYLEHIHQQYKFRLKEQDELRAKCAALEAEILLRNQTERHIADERNENHKAEEMHSETNRMLSEALKVERQLVEKLTEVLRIETDGKSPFLELLERFQLHRKNEK